MSAAPELAFTPDRGDVHVDLDRLVAGRLLIVADSGGGKTRAIRSFAEQTHGRVQQFLVDTEGDFGTLRERFDYLFVSAGGEGDLPAIPEQAGALCVRLLELQVSAIFDLYDLDVEERQRYTRLLLEPLTGRALPRSLWRPLAVVIDELKDLAPEGGFGESEATKAVVDLNTKGRKRAFFLVGATQRISSVDKNAISGIANKLIGLTTLDTDYARAGRMLGFQPRRYRELMELSPGEFFATGPAMSARGVTRVRTGDVLTTHIEPGRVAPPTPPAPEHIRALLEQLQRELPTSASAGDADGDDLRAAHERIRGLEAQLRRGRQESPAAVLHLDALHQLEGLQAVLRQRTRELGQQLRAVEESTSEIAAVLARLTEGARPADATASVPRPRAAARGRQSPGGREAAGPAAPASPRPAPARGAGAVEDSIQRVLDALATYEAVGVTEVPRAAVAAIAGYRPGGYLNSAIKVAADAKYLQAPKPNHLCLTSAGRRIARSSGFQSNADFQRAWLALADEPQSRLLRVLIEAFPQALSREALATASGYKPGGYFNTALKGLVVREAAEKQGTALRAHPHLFPLRHPNGRRAGAQRALRQTFVRP